MDYKIVIDAGHGGDDPGASGNGIIEKDLNLTIAQLMYQRFQDLGIPVTLIRPTDETISPSERVQRILDAYGNRDDVIVISNHINAGGGDGAEVIYALRNNADLANLIATELQREGQNIRNVYQRRLPSNPAKDYYFIHRETGNTQPVIVEYGFLDSTLDDVQQLKNDYPKYVDAVVRAVLEYIGKGSSSGTYTVKSGDSLWSIAKMYNTTVDALKSLNNLTSNTLRIGQVLKIPGTSNTPPSTPDENGFYIVKAGDSLWSIANKYNTTVDTLMRLNNLTSSNLSIGQQLRVPSIDDDENNGGNNGSGGTEDILYTVKSGDSLWKIANTYNTSVDALMRYNNLSSSVLNVGQVLRIPRNGTTTPTPPTEPEESYITYTVKSGDSLWSIANRYNTSVDALMRYNNLSTNLLNVGQVLRIPTTTNTTPETTYVVKSGDSLWKIANAYNTSVDAIKRRNNLTSNNLSIGQILIIP